jgi:hypothetical protein
MFIYYVVILIPYKSLRIAIVFQYGFDRDS